MQTPFDTLADRYDHWFESDRGAPIFRAETACLQAVIPPSRLDAWIEVGVGTGRFAAVLGIPEGVDPSPPMLEYAARRGIRTRLGTAESLPYAADSIDGILMVVTLCFVRDTVRTLREAYRVLAPGGTLVLGLVPAQSAWGRLYARKSRDGHPFYSTARFFSCEQVLECAAQAGFRFETAAHTLCSAPTAPVDPEAPVTAGVNEYAGFVAFRFCQANAEIGGTPS